MLVHVKQKLIAIILKHNYKQRIPNNCPDHVRQPRGEHCLITYLDFDAVGVYNMLLTLYANVTTNHTHKRSKCFSTCLRIDSLPLL